MTYITREIQSQVLSKAGKGKAILIIGPRQVGKSTLLKTILKDKPHLYFTGDDPLTRAIFENPGLEDLKQLFGNNQIVYFDEAQRINNIGVSVKLVVDELENIQIYLTGSSALDLKSEVSEPLTGRKYEFQLYPISWTELVDAEGVFTALQQIDTRLIFGMYPEIITKKGEEIELLKLLVDSYLYKDIYSIEKIRKPEVLEKLVKAIALQLGNEVSYNELSQLLQIDKKTVQNYIDILEKGGVLFRLSAYSGNLRNELKNNFKIYFWDNGIRNAILGNFLPVTNRNDIGALWENFIISELKKSIKYKRPNANGYFWRSTAKNEIDFIEVENGIVKAYEIKWNSNAKYRPVKVFEETYNTKIQLINKENFWKIIN